MTTTRTSRVAIALLGAVLLAVPLAGTATARPPADREDDVVVFNRDVFFVNGAALRNPDVDTPPEEDLYNVAGVWLETTWGEWSAASATASARAAGKHTDVDLTFSGLVPGGVYSVFWGTLEPDSEHPSCPGVERTLPLVSDAGKKQRPDQSSFVAGPDGRARFSGRAGANLLDGVWLSWYSIVYHFDGRTYHPFPNRGEWLTHDGPYGCRASYGEDAMRQLIVFQKGY